MSTSTWIIVAIAVVVLLIVLWLVTMRTRRERTSVMRERYGPEYDRRVEEAGSERAAQRGLQDLQERREKLDIHPLQPASRDRYMRRWDLVQADFVDKPGHAVDEADSLVSDVMRERGYPVDDFDTRADMISADHPDVVRDYRQATDARRKHHESGSSATTEELRRAMVHYRSLFERLVGGTEGDEPGRHVASSG